MVDLTLNCSLFCWLQVEKTAPRQRIVCDLLYLRILTADNGNNIGVAVQRNQWQQPWRCRSGWSPLVLIGSGFIKRQCVIFSVLVDDNSAVVLLERNCLICIGCCGHFV